MKKINNKGFLLLETLVVTTFVVAVLTYLYIQYINLKKNYNKSFTYNTVPGLLHAKEIDDFFNENLVYMYATSDLIESNEKYIELVSTTGNSTACNTSYFSGISTHCRQLMAKTNVKTVLLLSTNLTTPLNSIKNHYSNEFYNYIRSIKVKNSNIKYILAFEFTDKTYANILIKEAS